MAKDVRMSRLRIIAGENGQITIKSIAPKTLYVHRPLINAQAIFDWVQEQGFQSTLPEFHVTVVYSKTPVYWADLEDIDTGLIVRGGERSIERFGDNAVVLRFQSGELAVRNTAFMGIGCTSEYPDYKSHVTITYSGEGLNIEDMTPYAGELIFGPEVYQQVTG